MWNVDSLTFSGARRRRMFLCASMLLAVAMTVAAAEDESSKQADGIEALLKKAAIVRAEQFPFADRDKTKKRTTLSDDEVRRIAGYYRRQYPFETLRERLSYEQRLADDRPKPKLNKAAAAGLDEKDHPKGLIKSRTAFGQTLRAQSLAMLHSDEVKRFITQEGFGIRRFGPPSPRYLELPEMEPVAFDWPPALSTAHLDSKEVPLPAREPDYSQLLGDDVESLAKMSQKQHAQIAQRTYDRWAREHNPQRMPTWPRLVTMHEGSSDSFSSRSTNGYVKDVDHVAGFVPHALAFMPRLRMSAPRSRWAFAYGQEKDAVSKRVWQVSRMQLVSLLKHEKPGVYSSQHLPKMKELVNFKTRPLDEFEADALKRLRQGEDIVTRSRTNRVLMLGSLRAARQCLECHDVHRGELLGAFTYELTRKKPIVVLSKPPALQN